jgi:hypothetical protein
VTELATSSSTERTEPLEPVFARLPPELVAELRALARETRVPQATYLREAVRDLLTKYGRSVP